MSIGVGCWMLVWNLVSSDWCVLLFSRFVLSRCYIGMCLGKLLMLVWWLWNMVWLVLWWLISVVRMECVCLGLIVLVSCVVSLVLLVSVVVSMLCWFMFSGWFFSRWLVICESVWKVLVLVR